MGRGMPEDILEEEGVELADGDHRHERPEAEPTTRRLEDTPPK